MDDRAGHWLAGRYRLDRRFATDTTGDWYEAWDGMALLRVVVHLLAPTMLEPPDAMVGYEAQVNRLRALGHRNIVAVRDIAPVGATLFLVLDAPRGVSLAAVMRERERPFNPETAARILRPVADALDALHANGLVHRQVTPETITVGPDGGGILAPPAFVPVAMDATVFGRSPYLSPEQRAGNTVTGASDIYALGAVLYEMLTGACPYTGEQTDRPSTASRVHPSLVSASVDPALLSALNPHPASRPRSASLLVAAIARGEGDAGQPTAALARGADVTHPVPLPLSADMNGDARDHTGLFSTSATPEADVVGTRRSLAVPPVLAVFTLLVVVSALVLGTLVVRRNATLSAQESHYAAAEAALGRGDYDTAIAEFGAAGPYRDAPARVAAARIEKGQRANYDAGVAAFRQEAYATAAAAFGKAGTYRDAPQRRADALRLADQQQAYTDGQHALAREDYTTAAAAFARAGDYKDAAQQATQAQRLIGQQRQYQTGVEALTREDYATATAAFRAAGNYKDAPQQATQAEKLHVQKTAYDAGAAAFAREDYATAKQQFVAAGDYKDAPARAAQADQEATLLATYMRAQTALRASQWKDAYATLQEIMKVRPDYKDVAAVIGHLENDVVNPTNVDLFAVLNPGNGYTEGWVPVNNLIGQPVTWLYVVARRSAANGRPDQISAVSIALVTAQGSKETLSSEVPVVASNSDLRDTNALRAGERLFIVTGNGQTFEVAGFGKYRARLTVTNLVFPLKFPGNDSAGTTTAFFSRLTVAVTLTPKTP